VLLVTTCVLVGCSMSLTLGSLMRLAMNLRVGGCSVIFMLYFNIHHIIN
jgi:hypothetical protein